ncbi:NACHT domain-containing NTPase [Amycolatopsis sp. Hca4]|uniref:NACHT domain-containing protein n=1 Tax=Amycolatopsis sp. Hca4 TaxID=2742131 RepID=UPI0015902020|nr:NACHT domain-containing protein [Amycolatopsis sp. Hca4]QKV77440.1 NACHT domain-containing protein [Amycolatopsis sp. Hca4]
MSGLEAAAIALTTAVVKAAAKIWLGDRTIAADASAKVFELLEKQVTGLNDRRKLRLLFTNLESRVVDRLLSFLEVEFRNLPENERAAAVDAVRDTFERAGLTDDDLFAADLDAGYLNRHLAGTVSDVTTLLSADATELYRRVLRECCAYLVQITSTLPRFQPGALRGVLRRETEILETVRNVLTALPERRHPDDFAADFRRQVMTTLDRMALFGAGLADATRLYPLSVAYLSLSITAAADFGPADRIEHILPKARRILLRGEAGSGKTTMLQWLAVKCASRELRTIEDWEDVEPFLLRLRRYSRSELPTPEKFLDEVGRHIADEMPKGWVHERLRRGQAIVLVDGIDELPEERRPEVQQWLAELVGAFPRVRYVVTTRPAAVAPDWMAVQDFTEVRLQPMTPRDVRTFVGRWHAAMPGDALDDQRDALIAAIGSRSALRRLAENPLLCALLCALHHEGNGRLPDNRMELYEVALRMLLDSRDIERRIVPEIRLSLTEKLVLLRNLAYWMVRNGHTDIPTEDAEARIAAKLAFMGQISAGPHQVFRHLLDRGGVLREPVPGRIDFVHRTFSDYLAAKAAVEEDDIGVLVANANRDEWCGVAVMAAGHAYPAQRNKLIKGILDSPLMTSALVALACLETSPELPEELRAGIERRTAALIPPEDFGDAANLATAGEFALDLLAACRPESPWTIAATIRAAALIGGPGALDLITRFSKHSSIVVVRELVSSRERFDPAEYAEQVLAEAHLPSGNLNVTDPAMLAGLEHVRNLESLNCSFEDGYGELGFVRKLPRLKNLMVHDIAGYDLPALAGTALERLTIEGEAETPSVDIGPLADVEGLMSLVTTVQTHGWSRFAQSRNLVHLQLSWVEDPPQMLELAPLGYLPSLVLYNMPYLDNVADLSFLDSPRMLGFDRCPNLRDISNLIRWADSLSDVRLVACQEVDLAPLASLPRLRKLCLFDVDQADLTPLAGKSGLMVYVGDDTQVIGAELLGPGSVVE